MCFLIRAASLAPEIYQPEVLSDAIEESHDEILQARPAITQGPPAQIASLHVRKPAAVLLEGYWRVVTKGTQGEADLSHARLDDHN